jgi:hypothetical protein
MAQNYSNLTTKLASLTTKAASDQKRAEFLKGTLAMTFMLKGSLRVKTSVLRHEDAKDEATRVGGFEFSVQQEDGSFVLTRNPNVVEVTTKIYQYSEVLQAPETFLETKQDGSTKDLIIPKNVLIEAVLVTYRDAQDNIVGKGSKSSRLSPETFRNTKSAHIARGYLRTYEHNDQHGVPETTFCYRLIGCGTAAEKEAEAQAPSAPEMDQRETALKAIAEAMDTSF